jgi:hypothetical protein
MLGNLFWLLGPDYEQARQEFLYALEFFHKLGAIAGKRDISMPKIGPWEMLLKGGIKIRTRSAEDVRKLAAVAPDGIIMCEAAQQTYKTFLRCRGRLAETRGWMVLAGTFEESEDWYAELWTEFQGDNTLGGESFSLPMFENLKIFPGGQADPEVLDLTEAYSRVAGMVEERIWGIPVVPTDRFFREFKRLLHIGHFPYDPSRPVYICVDPSEGVAPYSVAAVQYDEPLKETYRAWDPIPAMHVIDVIYEPLIDEDAILRAKGKPWWNNVHGGSIDVEEPDSRKRWRALGGINLRANKWQVREGIKRMQSFIHVAEDAQGMPYAHLYIDENVDGRAVKEIPGYKRRSERSEKPHLDCADHFIKCIWYELLNRFGPVKAKPRPGIYTPKHRRM